MGKINTGRVVLGGIVAGIVMWLIEGAASMLYMTQMQAALEQHGLKMEMSAGVFVITLLMSFLIGIVAVFLYAAARPRFGAGPRTAVIIGLALVGGAYVPTLIGYDMIGLYPRGMLVTWGVIGIVELPLITIAGAWLYKEE